MADHPIIEDSLIEIHTDETCWPNDILKEDEYFGVLNIKIAKTRITNTPLFIAFTIDKTGSMNDFENGATKMDFVKQTFKNMMYFLSNQDVDIFIRVHSFNYKVDVTIDTIKITERNVKTLIDKIDAIDCYGSTDIEVALKTADDVLTAYHSAFPDHNLYHVFMTDGEATAGERNKYCLASMVNNKYKNSFVGFGQYHNAELLKKLSDRSNAEYLFVDDMENTSLVYGETIHKILYPAIKDVEIRMVDGLIYDWKINKWADVIWESTFSGEVKKIYQVKTTRPTDVCAYVYGKVFEQLDYESELLSIIYSLPDLIDKTDKTTEYIDLSKYVYRQRVQELLYQTNQSAISYENQVILKENIRAVFRRMRKYMRLNRLLTDPFMTLLCDDLSITFRTIGTNLGDMYSASRYNSQGRQATYSSGRRKQIQPKTKRPMTPKKSIIINKNIVEDKITGEVSNISLHVPTMDSQDDFHDPPSPEVSTPYTFINRRTCSLSFDEEGEIKNKYKDDMTPGFILEDEVEYYEPSDDNISCYATPSAMVTMREISQSYESP